MANNFTHLRGTFMLTNQSFLCELHALITFDSCVSDMSLRVSEYSECKMWLYIPSEHARLVRPSHMIWCSSLSLSKKSVKQWRRRMCCLILFFIFNERSTFLNFRLARFLCDLQIFNPVCYDLELFLIASAQNEAICRLYAIVKVNISCRTTVYWYDAVSIFSGVK